MIQPTVGRKVWYRPSKQDQAGPIPMMAAGGNGEVQPMDATVIAVWGDRCVNLLVIDSMSKQFPVLSCQLLQDDDQPVRDVDGNVVGRYAEWMPYQTGQARRDAERDAKPAEAQAAKV